MSDRLWFNGEMLDRAQVHVDPSDRGLLLGDGVFETMRVQAGRIAHLPRHLARLYAGLEILMIPPPPRAGVEDALHRVIAENTMTEGSLRLTLTRGCGPRGLLPPEGVSPTLLIVPFPPSVARAPDAHLVTSRMRRDENSPLSRVKTLNYLPNILALMEARQRGGNEAVLLNIAGRVAEANASNLLIQRDGMLLTPPVTDGALPGIARSVLLDMRLVRERTLTLADLPGAEAVVLINSMTVREAVTIDGVALRREPSTAARIRAAVAS
ncbi:aminotransferase class IV [Novacetimonas pomaceti]|uniref:aminotransferase class IV n=1 Tax=Novacetimonas pomaceti TaxID=2021998 RepID=UPI001C2D30AA|nr:aminotransferase class IV [Novacetimonas pomaceti]MBV1833549.1 aminotransferase class IV [Novacetimonas pomaceti]